MTTLAFDGTTLACDSRCTMGNLISSDRVKKLFKFPAGTVYVDGWGDEDVLLAGAFAGSVADMPKMYQALISGVRELEHDVAGIILGCRFNYHIETDTGYLIRYHKDEQLAEGSGCAYALSAMRLGLSAKDAVKHAIKFDCYSGGRVQIFSQKA